MVTTQSDLSPILPDSKYNEYTNSEHQLYFLIPWLFCVLTDKAIDMSFFSDYVMGIKGPEYLWIVSGAKEVKHETLNVWLLKSQNILHIGTAPKLSQNAAHKLRLSPGLFKVNISLEYLDSLRPEHSKRSQELFKF